MQWDLILNSVLLWPSGQTYNFQTSEDRHVHPLGNPPGAWGTRHEWSTWEGHRERWRRDNTSLVSIVEASVMNISWHVSNIECIFIDHNSWSEVLWRRRHDTMTALISENSSHFEATVWMFEAKLEGCPLSPPRTHPVNGNELFSWLTTTESPKNTSLFHLVRSLTHKMHSVSKQRNSAYYVIHTCLINTRITFAEFQQNCSP